MCRWREKERMTKAGKGRGLEEEEEDDREKRRQTLTSLFVLSTEKAHSWFRPECNTALSHSSSAKCPWRQMPQTMQYYTGLIVFHHLYFSGHEM